MSVIRRHGLVFALIGDPDGDLWCEVRRERDSAVVVSSAYDGTTDEFSDSVDEWIDDFITERVDEMELETCVSCNGQRAVPEPDLDDEPLSGLALIGYRFDLCMPCAAHLVATNPWFLRHFGVDACRE